MGAHMINSMRSLAKGFVAYVTRVWLDIIVHILMMLEHSGRAKCLEAQITFVGSFIRVRLQVYA